MKIIVVTGTNGKTTMAYLMYQALNLLGRKSAYLGTLGFFKQSGKKYKLDNTTPDICEVYEAMVDAYNDNYEFFILEASSQGLAQHRLDTIKYDYAVFTNLTHDHLDFHRTMENYAEAKRKVFNELKETGKAFLNFDDEYSGLTGSRINLFQSGLFTSHCLYFSSLCVSVSLGSTPHSLSRSSFIFLIN